MTTTLRRKYGITEVQYQVLSTTHCVLCQKPFSRSRLRVLDHRHSDGLIRGAPCVACNDLIGRLHDDAGWLRRTADYLDDPPAVQAIGHHYVPGSPGAAGEL